jgi:hypothetical protein
MSRNISLKTRNLVIELGTMISFRTWLQRQVRRSPTPNYITQRPLWPLTIRIGFKRWRTIWTQGLVSQVCSSVMWSVLQTQTRQRPPMSTDAQFEQRHSKRSNTKKTTAKSTICLKTCWQRPKERHGLRRLEMAMIAPPTYFSPRTLCRWGTHYA